MKTFDQIWISTIEHLNQFLAITANPPSTINRGGYNIPDNFPQTQVELYWGLLRLPPAPLTNISSGTLSLFDDKLSYKAYPLRLIGNRVRNLKDDLVFTLYINEIIAVGHYQFSSPVNKLFDFSFTRLQTTQEGILQNFLMCAGRRGFAIGKYRKEDAELFDILTNMLNNKASLARIGD